MDFGTTTSASASQYRATTAIGDRDVAQKGSYYRRPREKKQSTEEQSLPSRSTSEESQHSIDIRV